MMCKATRKRYSAAEEEVLNQFKQAIYDYGPKHKNALITTYFPVLNQLDMDYWTNETVLRKWLYNNKPDVWKAKRSSKNMQPSEQTAPLNTNLQPITALPVTQLALEHFDLIDCLPDLIQSFNEAIIEQSNEREEENI